MKIDIDEYELTGLSMNERVNFIVNMLQKEFNPATKKYLDRIKDEVENGFKFTIISYDEYDEVDEKLDLVALLDNDQFYQIHVLTKDVAVASSFEHKVLCEIMNEYGTQDIMEDLENGGLIRLILPHDIDNVKVDLYKDTSKKEKDTSKKEKNKYHCNHTCCNCKSKNITYDITIKDADGNIIDLDHQTLSK